MSSGLINENYNGDVNNLREKLLASKDNFENNLKSINLTIDQIVNQSINEEKTETQLAYPLPNNISNKRNPVGVRNNEIDRQHYKAMTWVKQNMNDSTPVKPSDGSINSEFMAGQSVQVNDPNGSGFIRGTIIDCNSVERRARVLVDGSNRRILVSFDDIKNSIEKSSVAESANNLDEKPDGESTTNADDEIKTIEKPSNTGDYQINDEYTLKKIGSKITREGRSMFDLILDEYGADAVALIEKLIPEKTEKPLEKEFDWYLANQDELVKKYDGRYIVVIDEKVVGDYRTYEGAYFESKDKYELGTFLIQRCSEGDKDYTVRIYTPYLVEF